MALFQHSVLNKYLSGIDEKQVDTAWEAFKAHFHNPEIQQNIRNSKEEEYQEGFLEDLFVKVLGYTKNPSPEFNLKVEQKNLTDSKKADGALLDGEKIRGVIELKGTETTDLSKVEPQAFGYKNKQPDALYVIISNFEKLRFYIDNAVDFLEFNLFQLTKGEFKVLWLCLGFPNFAKGLPKKIKDASLTEEENVTKKLYKDYSAFKHDIFESIKKHNPEHDPLLLFKKTQKLLDRFLFIFFAEDRLLLPPNSIRDIIKQWMDLRDKYDAYVPLYDRFKKYFGYMNEGHKGEHHEIFAYNGGLFSKDEVLDNLTIDDDLLYKHAKQLSNYDFESEVDVNILGHIFEHSLNEIEEINAELKGEDVDTSKTRRKKDGVFYTPKYITKYIVEHTVGKLCEEKKAGLDIDDEEYRPNRQTKTKKPLIAKLDTYREWLLDLTICDPACGSGAFLNQALEFLITEHTYIDELQAKLLDQPLVIPDIENQILEHNLFGVDINEESVEIAKLSLWLRTAQKGRKLTALNHNIKCGNSLIDDPEVAGEQAFNWNREFPTVFCEKEKQAYHVTWVTHNARTSQRMTQFRVEKGAPFLMSNEQEAFITREIARIVREDERNVMAYNICKDHVHLLLVCEPDELSNIVRKLKGRSSQKLKEALGIPKEEKFQLWAQKFNRKPITDRDGLANVQQYIFHNRRKHGLPPLDGDKLDLKDPSWEGKLNSDYEPGDEESSKNAQEKGNDTQDKEFQPTRGKGLQPLASDGKSLSEVIHDMCLTEEEAFRPEYTGGFDVVIGNPPYVRAELLGDFRDYFEEYYEVYHSASDLFAYFYEKGSKLINPSGLMGYISNTFDKTTAGKVLRKYLAEKTTFQRYVDFTEVQVFEGATTYPVIIILNQDSGDENEFEYMKIPKERQSKVIDIDAEPEIEVLQNTLDESSWAFLKKEKALLFNKLQKLPTVKEKYGKSYRGLITGLNKAFIVQNEWPLSDHVKYLYEGKELKKWHTPTPDQKLILFESGWTKETYGEEISEEEALEKVKSDFPTIMEHLLPFEKKAKKRYDQGEFWWELRNCAYYDLFDKPKIIFPNLQNSNKFCLDERGVYINAPAVFLPSASKTLLCVLNSTIVWEFLLSICVVRSGGYIEVKPQYFEQIPIPELKNEDLFEKKADQIIELTKDLQTIQDNLQKLLLSKFDIPKLSRKLQSWHELTFKQFLKELKKKKVELSLDKEAEWLDYFTQQKTQADALKTQIAQTDAEIDAMVYELYGLGEEEVQVVEGAGN